MPMRVAVGFRCHSGWAVAVTVSGALAAPVIVDRRRVELISESLPRQPYHAVAEFGYPIDVIAEVEAAANEGALKVVQALGDLAAIGLVAPARRIPTDRDRVLASHALLHAAEGDLYEQAIIGAAKTVGLPLVVIDPKTAAIGPALEDLRRTIGPPWQKDHKLAAAAAYAAIAAPEG